MGYRDQKGEVESALLCTSHLTRHFRDGEHGEWDDWTRVVRDFRIPRQTNRILASGNGEMPSETCQAAPTSRLVLNMKVKKSKELLSELIESWITDEHHLLVHRAGWTDDSHETFVISPARSVGSKQVFFDAPTSVSASQSETRGTAADWAKSTGALCSGNALLIAAVSAAFAGPLLAPYGVPGFGLHLRGQSSCGKSTALAVANSVWGHPDRMRSWRATTNGLEATASEMNDNILVLDEFGEIAGREASLAVYMLANGCGKSRANSTGKGAPMANFRVVFLSSGEISLSQKLAEVGKTAMGGQEARFVDIEADTGKHGMFDNLHERPSGASFSNELKAYSKQYYGSVGAEFVRRLVRLSSSDREKMMKHLKQREEVLRRSVQITLDGPAERVCYNLAIVALAGDLATNFGLTGWSKAEALDACKLIFAEWTKNRNSEVARLSRNILNFVDSGGGQHLERIGGPPLTDCIGYEDDDYYYFRLITWARIHGDFNPTAAAKILKEKKIVVAGEDRLTEKISRNVEGRPRHYRVDKKRLAAFAADEEDPAPI